MCQGYLRINYDALYEATSIVVMEHKYVPCATYRELLPVQHNRHAHDDVRRPASSATNSAPSSMDKVPFNTWFRTATRRLLIDIDAKPNAADSGTFSTARVRCETSEKTPTERRERDGLYKGCLDDMGCPGEALAVRDSLVSPHGSADANTTMQASFPRALPPVGDDLDAVRRRRRRLFTTHSHLRLTAAHTATEAKTRWMLRWGKRSNYCGDETTIRIVIWLAEVEEARARARDDSMTLLQRDFVIEPE